MARVGGEVIIMNGHRSSHNAGTGHVGFHDEEGDAEKEGS